MTVHRFDPGIELEKRQLLRDEQYWVNREGRWITFLMHGEVNTTRDDYSSIKKQTPTTPTTLELKALVIYNPTQLQLEKAGIRQECNAIATTAKLDWNDNSIDPLRIDQVKYEVRIDGSVYRISDIAKGKQTEEEYTIVNFGLKKI